MKDEDEIHIAQINVGRLVAAEGSPEVQGFFDNLDRVNALAEASPGFIWRLQSEAGNATDIKPTADPLFIVNMSVWESHATICSTSSIKARIRRSWVSAASWFERPEGAYQALWWVAPGHVPSIEEGLSKLWQLDRFGPTPLAFTFKARFDAPGLAGIRRST